MEQQIHEYQLTILRTLLFSPGSRFRDLNSLDIPNDHFTFHLNRLVTEGLVTKSAGRYSLSDRGKEFANRIDTDKLKLEKQAKVAIALHAVRQNGKHTEYLVHRRLKEPFYGWYGSQSGKIQWGETPIECARREFLEETGLTGDFTLKSIEHYLHIHADGRLLEDKYFWVFRIDNTQGVLKDKIEEGENIWMTADEFRKLENVFATIDETLEVLNSPNLIYLDRRVVVNSY